MRLWHKDLITALPQKQLVSQWRECCSIAKKIYNWVVSEAILFDKPILNVKDKLSFWDYDLPDEYEKILKL